MSTAFAAGEWERTWRTRRVLPFLAYEQSGAEHKRPLHLTWVGTILPVEHSWWRTHYPPNGWLCQCRVRQISRAEARRAGYDPETPAPDDGAYRWKNKRTGEVLRVPRGIDPGWQGNPGIARERNVQQLLSGKLGEMSNAARGAAVEDLAKSRLMRSIQGGEFGFDNGDPATAAIGRISAPIAALPDEVAALMETRLRTVNLSVSDAAKQIGKSERRHFTPDTYRLVQHLIAHGEMFSDSTRSGGFNFAATIAGDRWTIALKRTDDGRFIFLKNLRRAKGRDLKGERWTRLR